MTKFSKLLRILSSKCQFCHQAPTSKIITMGSEFDNSIEVTDVKEENGLIYINHKHLLDFDSNQLYLALDKNQSIEEIVLMCDCGGTKYKKVAYYNALNLQFSGIDIISATESISYYDNNHEMMIYKLNSSDHGHIFSRAHLLEKISLKNFIERFKTSDHIDNYLLL